VYICWQIFRALKTGFFCHGYSRWMNSVQPLLQLESGHEGPLLPSSMSVPMVTYHRDVKSSGRNAFRFGYERDWNIACGSLPSHPAVRVLDQVILPPPLLSLAHLLEGLRIRGLRYIITAVTMRHLHAAAGLGGRDSARASPRHHRLVGRNAAHLSLCPRHASVSQQAGSPCVPQMGGWRK
jgi:hypothetical protein